MLSQSGVSEFLLFLLRLHLASDLFVTEFLAMVVLLFHKLWEVFRIHVRLKLIVDGV